MEVADALAAICRGAGIPLIYKEQLRQGEPDQRRRARVSDGGGA